MPLTTKMPKRAKAETNNGIYGTAGNPVVNTIAHILDDYH